MKSMSRPSCESCNFCSPRDELCPPIQTCTPAGRRYDIAMSVRADHAQRTKNEAMGCPLRMTIGISQWTAYGAALDSLAEVVCGPPRAGQDLHITSPAVRAVVWYGPTSASACPLSGAKRK